MRKRLPVALSRVLVTLDAGVDCDADVGRSELWCVNHDVGAEFLEMTCRRMSAAMRKCPLAANRLSGQTDDMATRGAHRWPCQTGRFE